MLSLPCLFILFKGIAAVIDCSPESITNVFSVKTPEVINDNVLYALSASQHMTSDEEIHGKHHGNLRKSPVKHHGHIKKQDLKHENKQLLSLDNIDSLNISGLSRDSRHCFVFRKCHYLIIASD